MNTANPLISVALIRELIAEQFPAWAHLPIRPVEVDGWDNRTFRLGETMSVRLPSAERYAPQVLKEQTWLPQLKAQLSFKIPEPLGLGKPSARYPWHWSVYRWIEGQTADKLDSQEFQSLALPLGQFLSELWKIEGLSGPLPNKENFFRGGDLRVYDGETRTAVSKLKDQINASAVEAAWEKSLRSKWNRQPVWVHGDFSPNNIVIENGERVAIIDFGSMAMGDPACDLVLAWTNFSGHGRSWFKSILRLDAETWERAKGWALWKALITLVEIRELSSPAALKKRQLIAEILSDSQ